MYRSTKGECPACNEPKSACLSRSTIDEIIKKYLLQSQDPVTKYTPLKKIDGRLVVHKVGCGEWRPTNVKVEAIKVGEFCYIEEEVFCPVRIELGKSGVDLSDNQIDTKIMRHHYPDLDFDAYCFADSGAGLNIDGLTRITGTLYKITRIKS